MMVAGASPVQPVGLDMNPREPSGGEQRLAPMFESLSHRIFDRIFDRRPGPDMMEEFYAKERSFRDMIAEMGRRYAPLLGADDDPRMRQIKKYLFQNEMRKRLMRPPSGEFDI